MRRPSDLQFKGESRDMKASRFLRVASFAVLLSTAGYLAGCEEDPTEANRGVPEVILVSRSFTNQYVGIPFELSAALIDRQYTRLPVEIAVTSSNPSVVRVDSTVYFAELRETRVYATPLSAADSTVIQYSAEGLTARTVVRTLVQEEE